MHLPKLAVAALLAARDNLPSTYCQPQCPSCKYEYGSFDYSTSCSANSSFILNCGSCQSCVLQYALTDDAPESFTEIAAYLVQIIDACADSPISSQVAGLDAQASRFSAYLQTANATAMVATTTLPMPTDQAYSACLTASGSVATASCSSILSTATWASVFYAIESAAAEASSHAASVAATATLASQITTHSSTPSPTTYDPDATTSPSSTSPTTITRLSPTWIAGPIVGSLLGILTVLIVIYFTRRKQALQKSLALAAGASPEIPKEFNDNDSLTSSSFGGGIKAQLHAESIEAKELETREVYELPALEPVGQELNTPITAKRRDGKGGEDGEGDEEEMWPLPVSPLPGIFAMMEVRDQRMGVEEGGSPRHQTFYHA